MTVCLVVVAAGCSSRDDDNGSAQSSSKHGVTSTSVTKPGGSTHQGGEHRDGSSKVPDLDEGADSTTVETPSGGTVVTPPRPTQTRSPTVPNCESITAPTGRKLFAPPNPGLQATRSGQDAVLVTIPSASFLSAANPAECG